MGEEGAVAGSIGKPAVLDPSEIAAAVGVHVDLISIQPTAEPSYSASAGSSEAPAALRSAECQRFESDCRTTRSRTRSPRVKSNGCASLSVPCWYWADFPTSRLAARSLAPWPRLRHNGLMVAPIRTETLLEKLQYLPADKLAEVEDFVDSLRDAGGTSTAKVIEDCLCSSSPLRPAVADLVQGHAMFACAPGAVGPSSKAY
jgi:hypothetical protein